MFAHLTTVSAHRHERYLSKGISRRQLKTSSPNDQQRVDSEVHKVDKVDVRLLPALSLRMGLRP